MCCSIAHGGGAMAAQLPGTVAFYNFHDGKGLPDFDLLLEILHRDAVRL